MQSSNELKPSYCFVKTISHFADAESITKNRYHNISKFKKRFKSNSSQERNSSYWYKIENHTVLPEYKSRLNKIIVATGELFRLHDRNLPKYRIVKDKKREFPISKGIKNSFPLDETYEINYKEGMGRGILGKWYYWDVDFHKGNTLLDFNDYYHVIDHDRCFAPVTLKMHGSSKIPTNSLTPKDYETFPYCEDYTSGELKTWQWNTADRVAEAKQISSDERFLHEKHFATLKLILTPPLQKQILETHLDNTEDLSAINEILDKRNQELRKICQHSKLFQDYLKNNRMEALHLIIFEINDFFKTNKHYAKFSKKLLSQILQSHLNLILTELSTFLLMMGQPQLSEKEENELNKFIKEMDSHSSLLSIIKFYKLHHMQRNAKLIWNSVLNDEFEVLYSLVKENSSHFNLELKKVLDKYDRDGNENVLQEFFRFIIKKNEDQLPYCLKMIANNEDQYSFLTKLSNGQLGCVLHLLLIMDQDITQFESFLKRFPSVDFSSKNLLLMSSVLTVIFRYRYEEEDIIKTLKFLYETKIGHVNFSQEEPTGKTALLQAVRKRQFLVVDYFLDTPGILNQYSAKQLELILAELYLNNLKLAHKLCEMKPHLKCRAIEIALQFVINDENPNINDIRKLDIDKSNLDLKLDIDPDQLGKVILKLYSINEQACGIKLLKYSNDALSLLINEEKPDIKLIRKICGDANYSATMNFNDVLKHACKKNFYQVISYFIETPEVANQITTSNLISVFIHLVAEKQYTIANKLLQIRSDIISGIDIHQSSINEEPSIKMLDNLCHCMIKTHTSDNALLKFAIGTESIKAILMILSNYEADPKSINKKNCFDALVILGNHVSENVEQCVAYHYRYYPFCKQELELSHRDMLNQMLIHAKTPQQVMQIYEAIEIHEKQHPLLAKELARPNLSFFKNEVTNPLHKLKKCAKDIILDLTRGHLESDPAILKFLEMPIVNENLLCHDQAKEYKELCPAC